MEKQLHCCFFIVLIHAFCCFQFTLPSNWNENFANTLQSYLFQSSWSRWSEWGRCTLNCHQFRRRICRGFCPHPRKYEFQKQECSGDLCSNKMTNVSNNVEDFTCGYRKPNSIQLRIVGGRETEPHSWPWHVNLLVHPKQRAQMCGATLIHPQFVLTARHCVVDDEVVQAKWSIFMPLKVNGNSRRQRSNRYKSKLIWPLYIRAGEHNIDMLHPNQVTVKIDKVFVHPDYKQKNMEHDIALLKLKTPLSLNEDVQLACLPKPNTPMSQFEANDECTAIGFGSTDHARRLKTTREETYSSTLQEVNMKLTNSRTCRKEYRNTDVCINSKIHVCAKGRNKDTCKGDSGGGLFCSKNANVGDRSQWYIYGVTSFGHPKGCGLYSGVYQNLTDSYIWIKNTILNNL